MIAFFFLISIIIRASNVLGNILSGRPLTDNVKGGNSSFNGGGRNPFANNPFEQKQNQPPVDDGFADYEDVTEEEDK